MHPEFAESQKIEFSCFNGKKYEKLGKMGFYSLVGSTPFSTGHLCLAVVEALTGGQQSIESHAQPHQISVISFKMLIIIVA